MEAANSGDILSSIVNVNNNSNSSKRMKEEKNTVDSFTSTLSQQMIEVLQNGYDKGFKDDALSFFALAIYDYMMPELCDWLIKCEGKIKSLNLISCHINFNGAATLFKSLKENKSTIRRVDLTMNKLNMKCMDALGEYIKDNKSIQELLIRHNNITDKGIKILHKYVIGNDTLRDLGLEGNIGITSASVPLLLEMLESSRIINMNTLRTSIKKGKGDVIASIACNIFKYEAEQLDLMDSSAKDEDILRICEIIKKYGCNKLKQIILSFCDVTKESILALLNVLNSSQTSLEGIYLSATHLDDDCTIPLKECIKKNSGTLERLWLSINSITDAGVEILSESLIGNTVIKELGMADNYDITDKSAPILIEVAKKSSIIKIVLSNTSISINKLREIDELIDIPEDQREIPIQSKTKSAAKIF